MLWYDNYSLGVESIDNQHKELVRMIRKLQKSINSQTQNEDVREGLKFIVKYTQEHFADEERYMRKIGFPGLENHIKKHRKLIADVKNILMDLKKGKSVNIYDLIDLLSEWLIKHIRDEDTKIACKI